MADFATQFPDNRLIKRLPPQAFFTSYLSILTAQISPGAKETAHWLAALCYMKKPLRSPSRGHFEVEFRELTGTAEKTLRDHFKELAGVDLLRCYRSTARREFLIYPVGVVPLPDAAEMEQLTLLDVGEPKKSSRRKSAKTVGENPPTLQGRVGRPASLKPTYLPNPLTTAPDSRSKVGGNPPKSDGNSAERTEQVASFGGNPPKVRREKEAPPRPPKADTSGLTPEALTIFERLEQLGFWGDVAVVVARNAVLHGYTADDVIARAQTTLAQCEADPAVEDAAAVALYRLSRFVARPPTQGKGKKGTKGETASARRVREALEAQDAAFLAELDAMTPEQRQQREDEYNRLMQTG